MSRDCIDELSRAIERHQNRCAGDGANASDILSKALVELRDRLSELSAADEELRQQNEDLAHLASFSWLNTNPVVEADQEGKEMVSVSAWLQPRIWFR